MERDKFLTEVIGECWHTTSKHYGNPYCVKCHAHILQNNFSTWQGFGKLWEWAQEQEWFNGPCGFLAKEFWVDDCNGRPIERSAPQYMIDPDNLADSIYEFLKDR